VLPSVHYQEPRIPSRARRAPARSQYLSREGAEVCGWLQIHTVQLESASWTECPGG